MGAASEARVTEENAPVEAGATVHVVSQRFGTFEVPEEAILELAEGLIGFPELRRYVLIDHQPGSPFKWLLSIDDPELGFATADPMLLVRGYEPPRKQGAAALGVPEERVVLFALLTIPKDPTAMTINLMAPIVADLETRSACQLVTDNENWRPDHPVLPAAAPASEESAAGGAE